MGARATDYMLSVKFGAQRGPDGTFLGFDASPPAVKTSLAHSLTRLGVDYIDVYRPARLDPEVPIEETVGAIAELVKAGHVRHIGLSEVGAETIRRAHGDASDLRPADRVLAHLTRHRDRDPAGMPRAGGCGHRLWRAEPRPDQRPLLR